MITYLKDPSKDMHRDMAAQCFKLSKDEVSKMARYSAKNMFVFPQFYGDYYINCARSMWDFMDHQKLTVEGNEKLTLRKHLKRNGISSLGECDVKEGTEPGTFEHHIKQVEKHFWNTRFLVYRDWKKKWYNDYLAQGYFYTKTGFRIEGNFGRNDVINYPVQGSAFHCLLWSLIQIQKELVKRGMKALIIGQIHDSIVADVPDSEVEEYLAIVKNVMIKRIQKAWKWIIVPLEVEVEMSPIGGTWFDKKKVAI